MLNTPPTYSIYIAGLVFKWVKQQGGVRELEKRNIQKAALLYDFLDSSSFYRNPVARMAFFSTLRHIVTERPDTFFPSLRRIKQPALIVFGDQDRLVPARLGVRLAQHLPQSELVVLPDVGHVPQFEATDETLELLTGFLDRIPRREFRS